MRIIDGIRQSFQEGNIVWRQHALIRMLERGISRGDVLVAVEDGRIIEKYEDNTPSKSYLILGQAKQRPIHMVVSWDEQNSKACIITVYVPDEEHFERDWETRKSGGNHE